MKEKCHLFFETLGTRLKISLLLALREKPSGVVALSRMLNEERSKVSHALLSLLECGFVHVRKEGRGRVYSLNGETIVPLLGLVESHVEKYCTACRKLKR